MKDIHENIATLFGIGRLPLAPGTWGSLAGLIPVLLLWKMPLVLIAAFLVFFALGVVSSGIVEKRDGEKDPSKIIIDEFACIFLAFIFLPFTPLYIIAGFAIYRILDIIKVPPMPFCEKIGGGWGIMLDDLVAAIYTNLILRIIYHIL